MSDYQDYMLSLSPEIHLPLEETTATPLVNLGTLGGQVTGTHIATISQQQTIVVREDFSMRYDNDGSTNGTINVPIKLDTVVFIFKPTSLDEFILRVSNSNVIDSYLKVYLSGGELILESASGVINTSIVGIIGGAIHVSFVYSGTFVSIYSNGVWIKNENITFSTDLFDAFSFSDIVFECTNTLVTELGDVFTDTSADELAILCATETNEDCVFTDSNDNLLVTLEQNFLAADCTNHVYLVDFDGATQLMDDDSFFLEDE